MKPLLISFALFVPFALGARYYFVCQALQWCGRTDLGTLAERDLDVPLPDGRTAALSFGEYPRGALAPPRTPQHLATLDSLAAYLARYPDHALLVEAPVADDEPEEASGYYRDLGVARAARLASELQRRGIPGERLELSSRPTRPGQALRLSLGFAPLRDDLAPSPLPTGDVLVDSTALLGLRFDKNSAALSPTPEFAAYAEELVAALNRAPELRLTLIGHTDSRSSDFVNDTLGQRRADAVARYLSQLGYDRTVTTQTAGERAPVASNATEAGRFLNRRVEVRID